MQQDIKAAIIEESEETETTEKCEGKDRLTFKHILLCREKKEIKRIYTESFPKREQMPFTMMLFMSFFPTTKFFAFYEKDVPCGMIYMGKIARQAYVLFFAVDEKLRSRGYGAQILTLLKKKYPKCNTVVSIEPCVEGAPNFEMRKRHRGFYLRNGYSDSGYNINIYGIEQEILVCGGKFNRFIFSLFLLVYGCLAIPPIIRKRK